MSKRLKQPKRPVDTPDTVRLDEAYDELTREAYAVWIRMMVDEDSVLEQSGVLNLARRYNYKKRGFFNILRQLRNKGYVRYTSPKPFVPVSVRIIKRPLLVGYDRFVKLS